MHVLYVCTAASPLQPWFDRFVEAIEGRCRVELYDPAKSVQDQMKGAAVVIDAGGHGDHPLIDAAREAGVKLWQVLGTGLDHLDTAYVLKSGLLLANTPGQFSSIALAEHAMLLMLYIAKDIPRSQRSIRARVFWEPTNEELYGATLGLVGVGASGRELAKRARAFGMRVIGLDAQPISDALRAELQLDFFGGAGDLDHILAEADYLSLHVPLTAATRHLINAKAIALMKPTAVLINVARGAIVDENALIDALRNHRIRAAGLDVFEREPIELDHPLLHLENVVTTQHVAGQTFGTAARRGRACAENVFRVAQGLAPLHLITSPV